METSSAAMGNRPVRGWPTDETKDERVQPGATVVKSFKRCILTYCHNGRVGVMAEFGAATDFTMQTPEFKQFANDMVLHIAAMGADSLEELMEQPFVKDEARSIRDCCNEISATLQEQIFISRYIRWEAKYSPPEEPPRDPPVAIGLARP